MGVYHEDEPLTSENRPDQAIAVEKSENTLQENNGIPELSKSTQSLSHSELVSGSAPQCDEPMGNDVELLNYERTDEVCEASELLQSHESYAVWSDGESPVVVSVDPAEERSWSRLVTCQRGPANAKEAVAALNRPKYPERRAESSPLSYKTWMLQLTRRRRLEIFIAVGLSLWLAFFVVLAIFMNGNANVPDADSGSTTSNNSPGFQPAPVSPHETVTPSVVLPSRNNTLVPNKTSSLNYTLPMDRNKSTDGATLLPSVASPTSGKQYKISPTASSPVTTSATSGSATVKTTTITTMRSTTSATTTSSTSTTIKTPTTKPTEASIEQESTTKIASKQNGETTAFRATVGVTSSAATSQSEDELALNRLNYPSVSPMELLATLKDKEPGYVIGVGRADITGPPADANMMGYANPNQVAGGIHFRQYSRAFVVGQGRSRVLFINIDACMGSMLVKLEVLKKLKLVYGDLYNAENVCISGTHTHSAPAGFLQDVLFQITSMGYVPETLNAMVDGIVESVRIAHDNLAPGHILINKGELLDSNINRSPSAYLNNPESERKRYAYNVDKEMTLLKFVDKDGRGVGMINWFAVHCTSMNNSNSLISGDNKGYAELLFEQAMDPDSLPGDSNFVAAFAQSNEGDVSPNTRGPHCIDTGLPCDNLHSTCNGKVQNCIASGPGKDMFESTKIIANNQFHKAMDLYNNASLMVEGPVVAVHQYVDMTNQSVDINSTHTSRTCKPAMGFSFAAGTTDGPGAFDFKQGDKTGNAFWKLIGGFLHSPSQEQKDCHYPKPILLDTGEMKRPYSWQPDVVDTQLIRIGQLLISAVPGEFTTMSGRRLNEGVLKTFAQVFPNEKFETVIAGLANTYSDYIATFEEYHVQRYEGASTIYGPLTLQAYVQQYKKLALASAKNIPLSQETQAKDIKDNLWSLLPGVVHDRSGTFRSMGDVLKDVNESYSPGDTVSVEFQAGNPRNSPTNNITFLTIERELEDGTWQVVRTDSSWDTKYIWTRTSTFWALSEVKITWDIGPDTPSGHYRINHHGHYKSITQYVYPYSGHSKVFQVVQSPS
uniref:Neutral ceramidase n=1 Tax=Phallusia mammillata TaxID=59560 RepID=A0A6F9D7N3_9ASCI|nr:neutral ceramidase [Phallusia mammillata]